MEGQLGAWGARLTEQRRLLALLVGFLCLGALSGCSPDVTSALSSVEHVKVVIYDSGAVVSESQVSTDSPEIRMLSEWASQHQDGWSGDTRSYAPGILISSPEFSVNILQNLIVVVISHDEHVRTLSEAEYAKLSSPFLK